MDILQQIQKQIAKLPTYVEGNTYAESSHWYIRKDIYKRIRHFAYINVKAVRKAKARRKRLRAKCSR